MLLHPSLFRIFTVHLGGADKKTKDAKARLIDDIRESLNEYERVYVIEYEGIRTNLFKDVRMNFRDSRFVPHFPLFPRCQEETVQKSFLASSRSL